MSRYLQGLVMRSLGEVGGLIPRPLNRYETVRQGGASEMTEVGRETDGMDGALESRRSLSVKDASSRMYPPMTGVGPIEDVVERGWPTDTHSQKDFGGESIEVGRQIQREISGERVNEVNATKDEYGLAPRRPMDATRLFRHSSPSRPVSRAIKSQEEDGAVTPAPQTDVTSPERRGWHTSHNTEQRESLPETSSGAGYPEAKESLRPSVRVQEGSSDLLRPTLGDVSFRHLHREAMVPPGGERPPNVQIRIGRIEVRAVEQPGPAPSRKIVEPPRSSLPLDQYLRRRAREA